MNLPKMKNVQFDLSRSVRNQWPINAWKDITVLDVIDPSHFWVREAKSVNMCREAQLFYDLEQEITEYYDDFVIVGNHIPRKGEVCCIRWKGKWVRAMVLLKIDSPSKGYLITFFLVDWYEVVTLSELKNMRMCKEEWLEVPFQCVIVSIPEIAPIQMMILTDRQFSVSKQMSNEWDPASLTFVKNAVSVHTSARLQVLSFSSKSIEVELILSTRKSENILKDLLISEKFAMAFPATSHGVKNESLDTTSDSAKSNCSRRLVNISDCDGSFFTKEPQNYARTPNCDGANNNLADSSRLSDKFNSFENDRYSKSNNEKSSSHSCQSNLSSNQSVENLITGPKPLKNFIRNKNSPPCESREQTVSPELPHPHPSIPKMAQFVSSGAALAKFKDICGTSAQFNAKIQPSASFQHMDSSSIHAMSYQACLQELEAFNVPKPSGEVSDAKPSLDLYESPVRTFNQTKKPQVSLHRISDTTPNAHLAGFQEPNAFKMAKSSKEMSNSKPSPDLHEFSELALDNSKKPLVSSQFANQKTLKAPTSRQTGLQKLATLNATITTRNQGSKPSPNQLKSSGGEPNLPSSPQSCTTLKTPKSRHAGLRELKALNAARCSSKILDSKPSPNLHKSPSDIEPQTPSKCHLAQDKRHDSKKMSLESHCDVSPPLLKPSLNDEPVLAKKFKNLSTIEVNEEALSLKNSSPGDPSLPAQNARVDEDVNPCTKISHCSLSTDMSKPEQALIKGELQCGAQERIAKKVNSVKEATNAWAKEYNSEEDTSMHSKVNLDQNESPKELPVNEPATVRSAHTLDKPVAQSKKHMKSSTADLLSSETETAEEVSLPVLKSSSSKLDIQKCSTSSKSSANLHAALFAKFRAQHQPKKFIKALENELKIAPIDQATAEELPHARDRTTFESEKCANERILQPISEDPSVPVGTSSTKFTPSVKSEDLKYVEPHSKSEAAASVTATKEKEQVPNKIDTNKSPKHETPSSSPFHSASDKSQLSQDPSTSGLSDKDSINTSADHNSASSVACDESESSEVDFCQDTAIEEVGRKTENLSMKRLAKCIEKKLAGCSVWNPAAFDTEMASSFKLLNERVSGNILAVGDAIPNPLKFETRFDKRVVRKLHSMSFKTASVIQSHTWAAIFRGRNIIAVPSPCNSNILIYLAPLVSELVDGSSYESIPSGVGPLVLVLCATSSSAARIHHVAKTLIGKADVTCNILYPGNEHTCKSSLINGCNLLVATPGSLLRMIEETDHKILNISRLCHLVLNDADILTEVYTEQMKQVMVEYSKVIKREERGHIPHQIIAVSATWNRALSQFVNTFFIDTCKKSFKHPLLYFTSFYEAAIYAKVPTSVNYVAVTNLLNKLVNIFDETPRKKTIVFVSDNKTTMDIYNLALSICKNAMRADSEMNISELKAVSNQWKNSNDPKMPPVLVCTDSALTDLAIFDAQCIIHYDIPKLSRTAFGLRYNAMKNYLVSQETVEKCVAFLLVTDKCISQAPKLLSFVNRIQEEAPKKLVALADRRRKEVEAQKYDEAICYNVKAYGQCSYERIFKKQCDARHTLFCDLDKPGKSIPESGIISIYITRVLDAVHYYAYIVGHRDVYSEKPTVTPMIQDRSKMFDDMNAYYATPENQMIPQPNDIKKKNLFAISVPDVGFVRVEVTNIRSGKRRGTTRVDLFMVDNGNTRQCAADELLELPLQFRSLPFQAVEVFACNVVPRDKELNWNVDANICVEVEILESELMGQIQLCTGNTVWLHPLVKQKTFTGVNMMMNTLCMDKYLIDKGWAEKNKDHLKKLRQTFSAVGIPIPHVPEKQKVEWKIDDQPSNLCYCHLEQSYFCPVQVCHVSSPHSFFVQVEKYLNCLNSLASDMKVWAESKKRKFLHTAEEGVFCLAYCEEDDSWGRAKILERTDDGAKVIFLDFGDVAEVPRDKLLRLLDDFCKLPFQAVECSLADVCLRDDCETWSIEHADTLADFTRVYGTDEMLLLNLKVTETETREGRGNLYKVILLNSTLFMHSFSVGQQLINMGLANPKNQEIVRKICQEFDSRFDCDNIYLEDDELMEVKILKEMLRDKESRNKDYGHELKELSKPSPESHQGQHVQDKILTPTVKWAQIEEELYLSVKLPGVKNYILNLQENTIAFSCDVGKESYAFNFRLYGTIKVSADKDAEPSYKIKVKSRETNLTFFKLNPISTWPRLTEDEIKPGFLGIDFDSNAIASDDSEDDFQILDEPRYKFACEDHILHLNSQENKFDDSDTESIDLDN